MSNGLNNSTVALTRWHWEDFCGPEGFQIWSAKTHDLGICFQQLCFDIPLLALLAITSAFYFGRQIHAVTRGNTQLYAINIRCSVCVLLFLLPVLHTYASLESNADLFPIYYLLAGVRCLTWLCHLGFNLALRRRLSLSARGPVFVCVIWSALAVSNVISLRSNIIIYKRTIASDYPVYVNYGFSIVSVILQAIYCLTLIPNDRGSFYVQYEDENPNGETQSLLAGGNAFSRFNEERDPNYLGVAMEDSPWLSKLLFYWVNPLMHKGTNGKINQPDDLFDLPEYLSSSTISRNMSKALTNDFHDQTSTTSAGSSRLDDSYMRTQSTVSLLRALHKCFWVQFYSVGILKLISDCAGFAGPILLNKLVGFIEDKGENIEMGYVYAFGLFLTTTIGAFCNSHFNFLMSLVGIKIRSALVTTVYRKTLQVRGTVLKSTFSSGHIVNFMSTDTDRVVNSCPSFHALWSIPFQLGVTLYMLYIQVGLAFLAGVLSTIILIPINRLIANKITELSVKLMAEKDERVQLVTEIFRGIRTIKLHVWEEHFIGLVSSVREAELKHLKGRKYLDALCVYFWATTPVLISILTLTTYVLMGNKLTAATVFTSVSLLNMLIGPLNAFPWVLNGISEAWVSIQRIQKLLDLPNINQESYYDDEILEDTDCDLIIKKGNFNWDLPLTRKEKMNLHLTSPTDGKNKGKGKNSKLSESGDTESGPDDGQDFYLNDLDFYVKRGEFVGIIGTVGSGKSSILLAILGELTKQSGNIAVAELERGFGYVSQRSWLQRGTIRDNILFGKNYDESRYMSIVNACCLTDDLISFPNGDMTAVGEGGMTLSGGQRARISLARAVYQDKQIYLLDDIIATLDVKVAKHILNNCVMGILRNKTVILCTHSSSTTINCLSRADKICCIKDGTIDKQGKPLDVLSNIEDLLSVELVSSSTHDTSNALLSSITVDKAPDNDSVLDEETRKSGSVHAGVYGFYWKAIGHMLSFSILISLVLMQTTRNMTDWWLSYWVTNGMNVTNTTNHSNFVTYYNYFSKSVDNYTVHDYLVIYGSFAVLNTVFTLFRAFLFAYGGMCAASKIHKVLLHNVMASKITFFDISPLGRIINRFSSDTYTIDDSLPFILNIFLAQLSGLLGAVVITIYGLPWLSLILVPLIPIYSWLQNNYRLTSRELKRLSSTTLSPVYSHFNETLQGLSTIRAFRTAKRFKRDNEENVEINQKTQFASQAAAQWLGLRLQFIGIAMITGVGLLAMVQHQFDVADPGLVGLAISYALSVTGLLSGVVNAFTETEREMIAVERVNQYIEELPPEETNFIMEPPFAWPSQGVVSFNDVVLKYRDHLIPALKGVTFETRPAEKIGVVGRTGAGKSSLLVSLFRLVELYRGSIIIDTVNVAHISMTTLRSRIWSIPQEPFLFSGTVRANLDPLDQFRDTEIWAALSRVDLTATIRRMGGLQYRITSGGDNLSTGQRQLFCLARALLSNAKIICIDEATASVDHETDRQIQQTIRSSFRSSTVITIAHRIETILDCDRVLVIADGLVVEFDEPQKLLNDSNSHFYQLVNNE